MKQHYYKKSAQAIQIAHINYGIAIIVGSLLAVTGKLKKHPKVLLAFIATLLGNSIVIEISDGCPLTKAERKLLQKHNPQAVIPETFTGGLARIITKKEFSKKTVRTGVHIWLGALLLINLLSYFRWKNQALS